MKAVHAVLARLPHAKDASASVYDSTTAAATAAGGNNGGMSDDDGHWAKLTPRDAERLIAAGLHVKNVPESQCVQDLYCYQYVRPWEDELAPVQVLRLIDEVRGRSEKPHVEHVTKEMRLPSPRQAAGATAQDNKRRKSLLMALASGVEQANRAVLPELTDLDSDTAWQRDVVCKVEALTSPLSAQRTQQQQHEVVVLSAQVHQESHSHQTPEQQTRKRVRTTISPPVTATMSREITTKLPMRSPRWTSPKVEKCLEEEFQQPPRKTRRVSEAGKKSCSIASFLASSLKALLLLSDSETDDDDNGNQSMRVRNGDQGDSDADTDTEKEDASDSEDEEDRTICQDMQDALSPIWNALETTSSRFQSAWSELRECSSYVVSSFGDGFDDGEENEWTKPSESRQLAVRTRRQCKKDVRRFSAAWRLCLTRSLLEIVEVNVTLESSSLMPECTTEDPHALQEAALLAEFRSQCQRPHEVKITLKGDESPYHLSECDCVRSVKRGRYCEGNSIGDDGLQQQQQWQHSRDGLANSRAAVPESHAVD
ncbi:hypothetical protein FI667_g6614, partial [Globisporangium splendens]